MKNMKKLVVMLTVLATLFSLTAGLAGCKENGDGGTVIAGNSADYKIAVRTAGGMAMEGVAVSAYTDEALSNLQGYGQTNADGIATISLPQGATYLHSLSGVPKGYDLKPSYTLDSTTYTITLTSSLITGESMSETTLKLGDVMYDFTVTTPDGTDITLSEMLK